MAGPIRKRGVTLLSIVLICAAALALLLSFARQTAVAGPNIVALTPAPSATPVTVPFSATLFLGSDKQTVSFGEELLLIVDLDVVEGCVYPVFDLTLFQDGEDAPLFTHIDPPGPVISPGVNFPAIYRLRAVRAGEISFRGRTYGERNCNDFWNWTYVSGRSETVTVEGEVHTSFLPFQK